LAICIPTVFIICREQPPPVKTVVYKDHVMSILKDNSIEAISLSKWELNRRFTTALQKEDPEHLFSDTKTLAMVNRKGAYIWSDDEVCWKEAAKLLSTGNDINDILEIVLFDQRPFLVYPTKVVDLSKNRIYDVPTLKWLKTKNLSLQAIHINKNKLWFGTGFGEWGGHLLILDIDNGQWIQAYNPFFYVNSITGDNDETIWVAWAMSHFIENSKLIPITSQDKKAVFLKNSYIQVISHDKYDGHIHGIDRNYLVRYNNGILEQLADLGEMRYVRNKYAIGVLPAIDDLLIVDKDVFLIPHKIEGLFLYEKGVIKKLQESKSTAYWFIARYNELKEQYKILRLRIELWLLWLKLKYFGPVKTVKKALPNSDIQKCTKHGTENMLYKVLKEDKAKGKDSLRKISYAVHTTMQKKQ
jgi:hypothetical protein